MKDKIIFLTQRDLVKRWDVSEKTIARWRKQGTRKQEPLSYYRISSMIRFKPADIEAYETKHCLAHAASTSASDDSKIVKPTVAEQFCSSVMEWMQFPLAMLKDLPKDSVPETSSLEVAIGMLEEDEAESRAAHATSKGSVAKPSDESNDDCSDDLIQLLTKLVKTPVGELRTLSDLDLRLAIDRVQFIADWLRNVVATKKQATR